MRFYVERTLRAVFTIWAALTLTFALIRFMPGGPVEKMRGEISRNNPFLTEQQIQSRLQDRLARLNINLEKPMHEQYVDYMVGFVQGNLGYSIEESRPVADIVGEALPWTLLVMVTATVLVFIIAIVWGALVAYYEGGIFDTVSSSVSILTSAVPFYVMAFALLLVFSFDMGLFPSQGRMPPLQDDRFIVGSLPAGPDFWIAAFQHAALPIASVVLTQAGLQTLAMRGNSIQVLGEDFVRVARLRGLADRRIATRYVARNAILPLYTGFLTLIGFNLGASIILEQVFRYRGLGWYMFQGLESRDYALVMGTFLVYTVALVLAVYIADLTYSKIDPRVKQGDASEAY